MAGWGTRLRQETCLRIVRHTSKLVGRFIRRRGICVRIWRVFSMNHISFMGALISTASRMFIMMPLVRVLSTKEKDFSTVFIKAIGYCELDYLTSYLN